MICSETLPVSTHDADGRGQRQHCRRISDTQSCGVYKNAGILITRTRIVKPTRGQRGSPGFVDGDGSRRRCTHCVHDGGVRLELQASSSANASLPSSSAWIHRSRSLRGTRRPAASFTRSGFPQRESAQSLPLDLTLQEVIGARIVVAYRLLPVQVTSSYSTSRGQTGVEKTPGDDSLS
jgi:hypothetical protein